LNELDTEKQSIATNIASMRLMTPVNGAAYEVLGHTSIGIGGGVFYGVAGAAAGTYTDNNGTIIVPTGGDGSAAFLREDIGYVTPEMFGAVGDGVIDDAIALTNADASGAGVLELLQSTYRSSLTFTPITPIFSLGGSVVQDVGTFFPKSSFDIAKNPYVYGQRTFYAADYTAIPVEFYTEIHEGSQYRSRLTNFAGYQEKDTAGNYSGSHPVGLIPLGQTRLARTGIHQMYLLGSHSGFGDCYNQFSAMSASQHSGTPLVTSWSGQNSSGLFGGQVNAITAKVNLYALGDISINDKAFSDVAMFGQTLFLTRDGTDSGAYSIPRIASMRVSLGALDIDAFDVISGKAFVGYDASGGVFSSNTAIALSQTQRIAWDAAIIAPGTGKFSTPNVGTTYTYFTGTALVDVVGGVPVWQKYNNKVISSVKLALIGAGAVIDFEATEISTVATAGIRTLPTNPEGFINIRLGGVQKRIPYYAI